MSNTLKQKVLTNRDNSKIVRQLFFNVVFIVILSDLIGAITSFTDGICASRLVNDAASAALAVVSPLVTFVKMIVCIIQIGTQILTSKKLAQGDIDGAKKVFATSIAISVISGLLLALVIIPMCYQGNILYILGADDKSYKYAIWYVIGISIGLPFYIAYTVLFPIANLVNGKKLSAISIVAVLFINVIGDIISGVIFRYGSGPIVIENGKWAILGIAASTMLSFLVGLIILSFVFRNKKSCLKFSFKSISLKTAGEVALIGLPAGTKVIFIFLRGTTINILFNHAYIWSNAGIPSYDPRVLFTALSAQGHITPFVDSINSGLIAGALSLSSIFYAEEDEDSLNELLKLVIKSSFVVLLFSAAYALCAGPLVSLYGVGTTTEEEPELARLMVEQSRLALIYDALALPFVTLNASFLAFFQGTKQTKYAYFVTFLQSLVLPLSTLMLFTFCLDFNGNIWFGITFGFIVYVFIHLIYAYIYSLTHKNKFRLNARSFFFLPKSFGYNKNQRLKIQIKNIVDANNVPDQIIAFCKKQKIDKTRTNSLATCSEELARSIVISGFTRDRKKHHLCELCISYKKSKNNDIILRLRDDCVLYDIIDRANHLYVNSDPAANAALKVTYKYAKQVKYSNLLKTNNLVVTI